jgi:hypothetical protein
MKLTNQEITEAGFIFERERGFNHSEFEKDSINQSSILHITSDELEQLIVKGLDYNVYENETERTSAYWALSKRVNKKLIAKFRNWLKVELENNQYYAIYQILIALDYLEENVFSKSRTGRDDSEFELNRIDALSYLNKK